jgi:hypothetical protein
LGHRIQAETDRSHRHGRGPRRADSTPPQSQDFRGPAPHPWQHPLTDSPARVFTASAGARKEAYQTCPSLLVQCPH